MTMPPPQFSSSANPWGDLPTPYEQLGGDAAVRRLTDAFYDRVRDESPLLRAMHPQDLTETREKLCDFLTGWLGGPPRYIEKHGHPRLRMRHMPFPINATAVHEWLACMNAAMDDCNITGPLRAFLASRFTHTAHFMQNQD